MIHIEAGAVCWHCTGLKYNFVIDELGRLTCTYCQRRHYNRQQRQRKRKQKRYGPYSRGQQKGSKVRA